MNGRRATITSDLAAAAAAAAADDDDDDKDAGCSTIALAT